MSPNVTASPHPDLRPRQNKAAELVAQDHDSDSDIARQIGIEKRTLERWKLLPAFRAQVDAVAEAMRQAIRAEGIANKQNRIDASNRDWEDLERLKAARAAAYAGEVPGGETGLIVGRPVLVRVMSDDDDGKAPRYQEVMEYRLDTGLIDARLKLQKQVAQELGQWVEKVEGRQEHAILGLVGVTIEDL